MSKQTTVEAPKYVKYWEHETPVVINSEKNEVRIYAQHGKIQVYPTISKGRGIGKGATINMDTFTTEELHLFASKLKQFVNAEFESEKKYWENEEPTVLSTAKNEIRFYPVHGKLQVFPKIESGRGIGKGATLNFEGMTYETACQVINNINGVYKSFINAPGALVSTPPPVAPPQPVLKHETEIAPLKEEVIVPQNVVTTPPSDNTALIQELLKHLDPSVAAQYRAMIGLQPEQPKEELKVENIVEVAPISLPTVVNDVEHLSEDEIDEDKIDEQDEEPTEDKGSVVGEEVSHQQGEVITLSNDKLKVEYEKQSNIDAKLYNPEYTVALFEEIKKRVRLGKMKY